LPLAFAFTHDATVQASAESTQGSGAACPPISTTQQWRVALRVITTSTDESLLDSASFAGFRSQLSSAAEVTCV